MSINKLSNLNQAVIAQLFLTKTPSPDKTKTATVPAANALDTAIASAPKTNPAADNGISGRLAGMPELEQYEALIQRFLSGESEMENYSSNEPLTEDQIALRGFMRKLQMTDTRSFSQVQADATRGHDAFIKYWESTGDTGPMPAVTTFRDGTFKIHNSKKEHDDFLMNQNMDILKTTMSVINARKAGQSASAGNNIDIKV